MIKIIIVNVILTFFFYCMLNSLNMTFEQKLGISAVISIVTSILLFIFDELVKLNKK